MAKISRPVKGGKTVAKDKDKDSIFLDENAHITETAPKNLPKPAKGISATAYVPGGVLTRNDIVFIAETAWDAQEFRSLDWAELDGSYQRSLFDIATDICLRGGPTTAYEQLVSDTYVSFAAGELTPPPPEVLPESVEDVPEITPLPVVVTGEPSPAFVQSQIANLDARVQTLEGTWETAEEKAAREKKEAKEARELKEVKPVSNKPFPEASV
jgi:hypothetical protein